MSNKWDDKLTEKFLTLYRKHECLWNPYSADYKNCAVKNEAFKIVVQDLDDPTIKISECLQQIEVIREKYKEEQIKAEEKLKSGKLYISKLPWFNLMSQMLCEVINDEENFIEDPMTCVPCSFAGSECNKIHDKPSKSSVKPTHVKTKSKLNNLRSPVVWDKASNLVNSGSKRTFDVQSWSDHSSHASEALNGADDPRNLCLSCSGEKKKSHNKSFVEPQTFGRIRIEPVVAQNTESKIIDPNNNGKAINQLTSRPKCDDVTNCSSRKTNTPEINVPQSIKKVKINSDIKPSKLKACNIEEGTVHQPNDCKALNSLQVISSEMNCGQVLQRENESEKNVIMYPSHVKNNNGSQYLRNLLPNFETNHQMDVSTPNIVLYQDCFNQRTPSDKDILVDRHDPCIEQLRERNNKFDTKSEDDTYEVHSRFKIIIPTSDQEGQNLEITGYEVQTVNPQVSRYVLSKNSAAENPKCPCELAVPNTNANQESARYNDIIKLNIKRKHSKQRQGHKRSGKPLKIQKTDSEHENFETEVLQCKSYANKKNQTERIYEHQAIQTSANEERTELNVSKPDNRDIKSLVETSSRNEKMLRQATHVPHRVETVGPDVDNSLVPANRYNNTRTLLNVIVKILASDEHNQSEDLQETLSTMLHTFQDMSIITHNATKNSVDNSNRNFSVHNDTSQSTHYGDIPTKLTLKKQQVRQDLNPRKPSGKTIELDNTSFDVTPRSPIQRPQAFIELPDGDVSKPQVSGGSCIAVHNEDSEMKQSSGLQNERGFKNGAPNPLSDHDKMTAEAPIGSVLNYTEDLANSEPVASSSKKFADHHSTIRNSPPLDRENPSQDKIHSVLDYTKDFADSEPTASSSRKFEKHRSPSQLANNFLEVIKYTMMMDEALELAQNGNKDCCKKSTAPH